LHEFFDLFYIGDFISVKIFKFMFNKTLIICALSVVACTNAQEQQLPSTSNEPVKQIEVDYAEKVKQEFLFAWKGYKEHAWESDYLKPISMTGAYWYTEPLHLSHVEAMMTMKMMGLEAEFVESEQYLKANLDFDKDMFVSHFEIVIRMLGGLTALYQHTEDPFYLEKATDLADRMLPIYDSPTGMPYTEVNLKTREVRGNISNPAQIGTLILEYGTLAKLTGRNEFYAKPKRALTELYNRRSDIDLVGFKIDVETGEWTRTESHIGAGIDSYYEYLYKCWALFGDQDCKAMWDVSNAAIHTYLVDTSNTGYWYGHSDMNTGARIQTWYGALDAFFGGVLLLSGDIERAKAIQESGFYSWNVNGMMPEQFDYMTEKAARPAWYKNPELIESAYYLYHKTKDERYREMGRIIFNDIVRYSKKGVGFVDVMNVETLETSDRMETYFLAETLKYLYLLFLDEDPINHTNTVFNTEAHPLKIVE
jgi:ER degradation enhancer, mannosidase alpha-like 2